MKNFMQLFASVGLGTAFTMTVFSSQPAQAVTLTQNFLVNIISGGLAGETFQGSFSYDDNLSGDGFGTISATDGLTLDFNFLGTTYTEEDDFSFPLYPTVRILNGTEFTGLSYFVATDDILLSFDDGIGESGGIGKVFSYEIGPSDAIIASGEGEVQFVPEPATILGTLLAGSLGLAMRRKVAASTKV